MSSETGYTSAMQQAKVTSVAFSPSTDEGEWDEADCLCQGKIPPDKAVEYSNKVYRERDKRWVWKVWLRVHFDCPIHGCSTSTQKD